MAEVLKSRPAWRNSARSDLERTFRAAVERRGLPMPAVNEKVTLPSGQVIEVDLAWLAWHLVGEVDHPFWHDGAAESRRDKCRDRKLLTMGIGTMRFTDIDVERALEESLADLEAVLRRRGQAGPARWRGSVTGQDGRMTGVRVATAADLGRAVRTAVRAFADDPVLRWFFQDDAMYEAAAPSAFGHLGAHSISLGCTYVTADAVAVGIYLPPGRPEAADGGAAGGDELPADLAARFAAFGQIKDEHTPPQPHWYLNVLATHPDWQRQGLGAAIVAPIAERCRTEGLPLYLETETVANVAYYRHLGFEVRSEWDVPLDGPHMWGMLLNG